MKRHSDKILLVAALVLMFSVSVSAQSSSTSPAIRQLFQQSITAIDQGRYLQATQYLTRLVNLPENAHSQQAQEMLGNVREANGQLAHAVAEYEIYLGKYPNGAGATRVERRLDRILAGAAPSKPKPDTEAIVRNRTPSAAVPADQRPTSVQVRRRYGRSGTGEGGNAVDPTVPTVISRGSARLVYRYNEGSHRFTELLPGGIPGISERDDDVFDNALSLLLRYTRIYNDQDKRITLTFSGNQTVDFEDSDDNEFRLYEAYARYESKSSGLVLTFGRQKMEPRAIAYRLDGLSLQWPVESGITLGAYAGSSVESTRDEFFGSKSYIFGVSATLAEGMVGPGALSGYLFEQRTKSYTDRRVIGLEYDYDYKNGGVFANTEFDLQFGEFNRVLVTGTRVLPNTGRVTARLAYYRSPTLSLKNALIGQSAADIDALKVNLTQDEIEDLALDRTAKVTTFGLTYNGPINDTWRLSAYGSLYHTTGTPATIGLAGADDVAAVESDGVRSYFGVGVTGSSVFQQNDRLNLGVRYANNHDSDLYILSSSMRIPLSEQLVFRPRVRLGYRDEKAGGTEKFVIPSVYARYKIDRQTDLQFEIGGQWSENKSATQITKETQLFITAGIARSF